MKLSEAIRLGAMLRPQCFGRYYHRGASCTMGAAAEALGLPVHTFHSTFTGDELPHLWNHDWPDNMQWMFTTDPPPCPECGDVRAAVDCTIRHLNDQHNWTREQIADWVETVELSQAELPQPVIAEEVTQ